VGIDLGREPVTDATTRLKFRRLLNINKLGEAWLPGLGQERHTRIHSPVTGHIASHVI
jgi:IS5 family transposase